MRQSRWHLLLLPLAALIAIAPLISHGYSCGHDFSFHIVNWIEVAAQWHQGILYPHWAASAAYGAGEPRFVFYPPLSWTLGALLGLILPWNATPAAYTFLALSGCGLSMYCLAREWTTPYAALLAAAFYTVNPYMLFVAYERTAYAELLAAAWLPLLFLAVLRRRVGIAGVAIPVALLWLTNAPAAVMGCYALAALALVRIAFMLAGLARTQNAPEKPLLFALKTAAGTVLGLALAAIYIVPAAYERRWAQIEMAMVPGMRIRDSFLFRHTADSDHDTILWTASAIAVLLFAITLTAAIVICMQLRNQRRAAARDSRLETGEAASRLGSDSLGSDNLGSDRGSVIVPVCAMALVILFLQFPVSGSVWNHAPELKFLQFPWRWLAVLSVAMSLLLAISLRTSRAGGRVGSRVAIALLLAAALVPVFVVPAAYRLFHQSCDEDDGVSAQLRLFRSGAGSEPTDEYTPKTADNDELKQSSTDAWLTDDPNEASPAPAPEIQARTPIGAHATEHSAEHWRFIVTTDHAQFLVLRLRNYPAWRVRLNGARIAEDASLDGGRNDGLMAIPIPTGKSHIDIRYTPTPDWRIGETISALAFLILMALRWRSPMWPSPKPRLHD